MGNYRYQKSRTGRAVPPPITYDDQPGLLARAGAALWAWARKNAFRHRIKLRPVWFALAVWPLTLTGRVTVVLGGEMYVWITLAILALLAGVLYAFKVRGKRDRAYFAAGTAVSLGWVTAGSYWLNHTFSVFAYTWLLITVLGLIAWLFDHRIRSWIRLQKWGDEYEVTLDIAGLGHVIQRRVEEEWDAAKKIALVVRHFIEVPRGMDRKEVTAERITNSLPAARPNSVTVIPDPKHARRAVVQYVPHNPWDNDKGLDKPIKHPVFGAIREINKLLAAANLHKLNGGQEIPEAFRAQLPPELRRWVPLGASVSQGIPLGDRDDGTPIVYVIWDVEHGTHHLLVGGQKGGGKTNFTNVLIAGLAPCYDAIIWGIDVRKKGLALVHWGEVIDWVATEPEEATFMLRAARALIEDRGARAARNRRMTDKLIPSRDEPLLVVVIDEGAALCDGEHEWNSAATKAGEEIATGGRSECITEVFVTQRPVVESMGNSGTWRAQMDDRISFRNANPAEGRFTLNSWDKLDTSCLEKDGMFFVEVGAKASDARLCRTSKFCDPPDIGRIAKIYGPHRPGFNAADTATILRIAGQFYTNRKAWLDPNYVPAPRTPSDPLLNAPIADDSTGAPLMINPNAGPKLFEPTSDAAPQKSVLDTDPVVRARAEQHAATLNEATEDLLANQIPRCPETPDGDLDELVQLNTSPGEKVNMTDKATKRIWDILVNRGEQGIQTGELTTLANVSTSTVSRRLVAMNDAGMAFFTGGSRSIRWFAKMDHPLAKQPANA